MVESFCCGPLMPYTTIWISNSMNVESRINCENVHYSLSHQHLKLSMKMVLCDDVAVWVPLSFWGSVGQFSYPISIPLLPLSNQHLFNRVDIRRIFARVVGPGIGPNLMLGIPARSVYYARSVLIGISVNAPMSQIRNEPRSCRNIRWFKFQDCLCSFYHNHDHKKLNCFWFRTVRLHCILTKAYIFL